MADKLATELTALTAATIDPAADLFVVHDVSTSTLKKLSTTEASILFGSRNGIYNALDYGADGSAAAIQAAIDAAAADGGGTVYIPPAGTTPPVGFVNGVWDISSTSIVPANNVKIVGAGVQKQHLFNCPDLGWTIVGGTILDGNETGTAFRWHTTDYGTTAATFDNGTDVVTSAAHGLVNGDRVAFATEAGAIPTGLTEATSYYVINKTADTWQLSTTEGGSAINFTTDGSGTIHFARLTTISNIEIKSMGFIDCVRAIQCGGQAHAGTHGSKFNDLWAACPTSGISFASEHAFDIGNSAMVYLENIHTYQQRKGTRILAKHITCSPGHFEIKNFSHFMSGTPVANAIRGVTLEVQDGGTDVWQLDLAQVSNGIVLTAFGGTPSNTYHYESIGDTTSAHSVNNCSFNYVSSDGACTYSFFCRENTNLTINMPRLPTADQTHSAEDINIELDDCPRTRINVSDNKCRINADANSVPSFVFGHIQGFGSASRILQGMYHVVADSLDTFVINGSSQKPGLLIDFASGNLIPSRLNLTTTSGATNPNQDYASSEIGGGLGMAVVSEANTGASSLNLGRAGMTICTNTVNRTHTINETEVSNRRVGEQIIVYKKSGAGTVDVAFSGCTYNEGLTTTIAMTAAAGRAVTLTYTGDAHFILTQNW